MNKAAELAIYVSEQFGKCCAERSVYINTTVSFFSSHGRKIITPYQRSCLRYAFLCKNNIAEIHDISHLVSTGYHVHSLDVPEQLNYGIAYLIFHGGCAPCSVDQDTGLNGYLSIRQFTMTS